MVVLVAEDRQGTGVQAQQAGHSHLQAQVPGGQGPQGVPVAEQEHVVVGIADLGQETVGPGGDLGFILGPLAGGAAAGAWGFKVSFSLAAVPTVVALLFAIRTAETNRHLGPAGVRTGPMPPGTG